MCWKNCPLFILLLIWLWNSCHVCNQDCIPYHLHQRYYSTIRSNLKVHPARIHITVSVVNFKTSSGRIHHGVCSSYLSRLVISTNDNSSGMNLSFIWALIAFARCSKGAHFCKQVKFSSSKRAFVAYHYGWCWNRNCTLSSFHSRKAVYQTARYCHKWILIV